MGLKGSKEQQITYKEGELPFPQVWASVNLNGDNIVVPNPWSSEKFLKNISEAMGRQ